MNELINDEALYRTAPATPGLLKRRDGGVFQGQAGLLRGISQG